MTALRHIIIFMMVYLKKKNNRLKNIYLIKTLLIIILSAVVFSGCKKTEGVGLDVIADPKDALDVGYFEGFRLSTYSTPIDSVPTKNLIAVLLGSISDATFGVSSTGFYTQIRLSNNNISFGDNPVCDSIVLTLEYAGFYGDSTSVQHLKVFEMDEPIVDDTAYYSNDIFAVKSPALFDADYEFNLKDSIDIFGTQVRPHIRLYLDNSFGDKILDKSGSTELSNNEEFNNFINGLAVMSDNVAMDGGQATVNLLSSLSALTLYYHNDEDTTYEVFVINGNCDRVSHFEHDYASASPNFISQVMNGDTTSGQQEYFLNGLASSRGNITILDLDSIIDNGPYAVHMAELILPASPNNNSLATPGQITIAGINSEGKNIYLIETAEGSAFLGGAYDDVNKEYIFNITRTIQSLFLGRSELKGFRTIVSGESTNPRGVIINGADESNKTRLRVYYTKID